MMGNGRNGEEWEMLFYMRVLLAEHDILAWSVEWQVEL